MALDEREEMKEHMEEVDETTGDKLDDRRMQVCRFGPVPLRLCLTLTLALQQYANLFFLLQSEPRHIASLCRLVSLTEIDTLLQTVMFSLYGNQYESREEHLLLTMFQVGTLKIILLDVFLKPVVYSPSSLSNSKAQPNLVFYFGRIHLCQE